MHRPALVRTALAAATALVCSGSLLISSSVCAKDYGEVKNLTSNTLFVPDSAVYFKQIDDDWDDDWDDDDDDDWDDDRRYRGRYGDSDDFDDDWDDDEPWDDD